MLCLLRCVLCVVVFSFVCSVMFLCVAFVMCVLVWLGCWFVLLWCDCCVCVVFSFMMLACRFGLCCCVVKLLLCVCASSCVCCIVGVFGCVKLGVC